jgi:PBSX family phage terminase large subunit
MPSLLLTGKQSAAWRDILEAPGVRRILFDGGARSGKTALICAWLAVEAARYPGAPILIARKHRDHAKDSLYNDTLRKLLGRRREWRFRDGDLEIHHRNGSFLRVEGLDDAARTDKVLGTEYAHIFLNEATQLSWGSATTVLTRLAHGSVPVRKLILDCNPKSQRHWLYKAGVLNVDPDTSKPLPDADVWRRQHWTPYDNPHLPADTLVTLEALPGVQRRRMLKGEWCEAEGAVYEEFDEDVHVWKGPLPAGHQAWRKVRGIDFGYTNPFVCLWGLVDPDGRLWIGRERYVRQVIVQEHARAIKAIDAGPFAWTVADHDAEDRATLHAAGILTSAARKDVAAGIQAVKQRLRLQADGRPRLIFCDTCPETIGEVFDYAWEPPKDGRNAKEMPTKDRDHAMDAVRYMVMRLDHPSGCDMLI